VRVPARVTLTGHSDDIGRGTFNLSLSLARAGAVLALLKKRGVDPDLLSVRGAGPLEPLNAGSSATARSANRRVSFTVGIEEQP
jgi:outer membrane protein OmpA-like peptidoglycan-associated protein